MSPINAEKMIKEIKINNSKIIFISNKIENKRLRKKEINIPPIRPSYVLFGLILVNLFLPKFLPMMYENISKVTTMNINKLNFK